MDLESSDEEGKQLGSESSDVERFAFLQEDHPTIQELIAGIRRALRRKSITPQQICGLGKLLHGLERLPRSTQGIEISLSLARVSSGGSFYRSIELSDSSFDLWSGGSEYSPAGGDSYTTFSFSVEVGGFRSTTDSFEIEEWVSDFIESLCDEEQDFEVRDNGDDSVDWDDKTPSDDWDRLDSDF